MRRFLLFFVVLCWPAFLGLLAIEPVQDVCLSKVIDTAKNYNGKNIRLAGYLELRPDGDALFLSQEDVKQGRWDRAVALEWDRKVWKQRGKLAGNAVMLEGLFDSTRFGNTGYYAGTISRVNKATILQDAEFSQIRAKCGPLTGPASK